ncbi:MAG: fibronectin type III domain-containing protein [Gaiellaceae bacterium]
MTDNTGGRLAGDFESLLGAQQAPVGVAPTTRARAPLGPRRRRLGTKASLLGTALLIGFVGPAVSEAGPQHPKLHSMTPDTGPPGTVVVFQGVNLEPLLWVEFAGTPASFTSVSSTRFEAVVPEGASRGRVTFATDLRKVWGPVFKPTTGGEEPPPPPPPTDTTPPSTPQNVRVTNATQSSVSIAWNASTDDVGVAGYGVYRDGSLSGTTTATSATFQGLACGRSFNFGVNAHDAAGNRSGISTVSAATTACTTPPPDDATAPSAPGNLRSTGATQTSVQLAWAASSDNVGVAGYGLYRNGGSTGTTASTNASMTGLACGTSYTFGVDAYDAAGNRSPRSTVAASTSACSPTPPPPPPPPPPGGGGSCSVADTSGCVPATTLTFRDGQFLCDQPLASYGPLPLKVVLDYTPGRTFSGNGAVDLITGCAGDGNPNTIDLIVDVRGDGRTYGPGVDAVKVRLEAGYRGGIQITGHADCGPREEGAHQDGVQLQGGRDITFVDFTIGNYASGLSTCQGAGGAFFYSGANGNEPVNTSVVRGRYIGCNHSLFIGGGSGSVGDALFRSGRTDGSDPVCVGINASEACTGSDPAVSTRNLTCETWNRSTRRWES